MNDVLDVIIEGKVLILIYTNTGLLILINTEPNHENKEIWKLILRDNIKYSNMFYCTIMMW